MSFVWTGMGGEEATEHWEDEWRNGANSRVWARTAGTRFTVFKDYLRLLEFYFIRWRAFVALLVSFNNIQTYRDYKDSVLSDSDVYWSVNQLSYFLDLKQHGSYFPFCITLKWYLSRFWSQIEFILFFNALFFFMG